MNKVLELYFYYKKKGFFETLKRLKLRYLKINKFYIFKYICRGNILRDCMCDKVYMKKGTIDELNKIRKSIHDLPREFYVDLTHSIKEFYITYYDSNLAHICWVFRCGDKSRFFNITTSYNVELNYFYTIPSFRGLGLQTKMVDFIANDLYRDGIKNIYVSIGSTNINSLKGIKKTCFVEICSVVTIFSIIKKVKI